MTTATDTLPAATIDLFARAISAMEQGRLFHSNGTYTIYEHGRVVTLDPNFGVVPWNQDDSRAYMDRYPMKADLQGAEETRQHLARLLARASAA